MFDVLAFNSPLNVINVTLAYENDENNIDFGLAEKKDGLKLLMTSACKLSAPTKKKVIAGSEKHLDWAMQSLFLANWPVEVSSCVKHVPWEILIILVNSFSFMASQKYENSHSESGKQWFS